MSTVRESILPDIASVIADELQLMRVRMLDENGFSKNKIVSEFILKIANIYGLQATLDTKITKNVANDGGIIPTYLADGDIDFSTFKIGTFDSSASIGSLVDNGFYTAAGTGSAYENAIMGNIVAVCVINGTQTVYSSDRGMWYRIYSIVDHYSGWSIPTYIGGSVNNITVSRAQADWLVANNSLTVGAVYRIFDNANYEYIVLTAATSNTFNPRGLVYAPSPIHRIKGTFTVGGDSVVFKGCWEFLTDADLNIGDVAWYCNRLYANLTGNKGTATGWGLDSINWSLINFRINPEFYAFEWHNIDYDYVADYVGKEADSYGNEFGEPVAPGDGFKTCYNDWLLFIDSFGSGLSRDASFTNNKIRRLYNNGVLGYVQELAYDRSLRIANNSGLGDIYKNDIANIQTDPCGMSISNNIFLPKMYADSQIEDIPAIYGNTLKTNEPQNYYKDRIDGNTLVGGYIRGCILEVDTSAEIDAQICNNYIDGAIEDTYSVSEQIITDNQIITGPFASSISTLSGEVRSCTNSVINACSVIGTNEAEIVSSVFIENRTVSGGVAERESTGSIFASLYIGGGEFSYTRDGTFKTPVLGSGCAVNTVASNGVTITGSNITTLAITIVHAGYYEFKYEASAQSPTKIDVEAKAFKGATAIPMLYKKITYVAIDEWINSAISGIVQLAAGDVVTVKYASPGGGTTTLLPGQINITVEYKGQ